MKKQFVTSIVTACLISVGGFAVAAPSPNASSNATEKSNNAGQGKDNAGRQSAKAGKKRNNAGGGGGPKVEIAHCGCNFDGSGLEWKHIKVSTNARGHLRHTADTSATCIYLDEEVSYLRGADDCRISNGEESNNIGGLLDCEPVPDIQTSCTAVLEPVVDDTDEEV
ncbi:MAG: hypothetical protein V7742_22725 [Halioglobus sp.]